MLLYFENINFTLNLEYFECELKVEVCISYFDIKVRKLGGF